MIDFILKYDRRIARYELGTQLAVMAILLAHLALSKCLGLLWQVSIPGLSFVAWGVAAFSLHRSSVVYAYHKGVFDHAARQLASLEWQVNSVDGLDRPIIVRPDEQSQ